MKKVMVLDLGECFLEHPHGFIKVFRVEEQDGTHSWMLNPDLARGDVIIKTATVFPDDKDVLQQIVDEPYTFSIEPEDPKDRELYEAIAEALEQKGGKDE